MIMALAWLTGRQVLGSGLDNREVFIATTGRLQRKTSLDRNWNNVNEQSLNNGDPPIKYSSLDLMVDSVAEIPALSFDLLPDFTEAVRFSVKLFP